MKGVLNNSERAHALVGRGTSPPCLCRAQPPRFESGSYLTLFSIQFSLYGPTVLHIAHWTFEANKKGQLNINFNSALSSFFNGSNTNQIHLILKRILQDTLPLGSICIFVIY